MFPGSSESFPPSFSHLSRAFLRRRFLEILSGIKSSYIISFRSRANLVLRWAIPYAGSQEEGVIMLVKLYALAWIVVAAATGALFVTGYLNEMTELILGFLFSALLFTGIIGIVPLWMEKHHSRHTR